MKSDNFIAPVENHIVLFFFFLLPTFFIDLLLWFGNRHDCVRSVEKQHGTTYMLPLFMSIHHSII